MAYKPNDAYARKARAEGYAARSVYKLEEIDRRYGLFRRGQLVLDLGASPGSWSQFAVEKVGPTGLVVGLDLQPLGVHIPPPYVFYQEDIYQFDFATRLPEAGLPKFLDLVLSDMAPKTTGMRVTDQARSLALCEMALYVAERVLRPGGSFVCKLFDSGDTQAFRLTLQKMFTKVATLRPDSTRNSSKEIFLIAQGLRASRPTDAPSDQTPLAGPSPTAPAAGG